MTETLIQDLLLILAAGLVAGLICRRIQVSGLIGYLIAGVVLGKGVLDWVTNDQHQVEHFAEAGVFLLLFSIGLEFSLDDLRRLGLKFLVGGTAQMLGVSIPVALLLLALGLSWQSAALFAVAVAFSSTVLVFKALSEWGQHETPHGIRAIGILLFQDAALVPLLLLLPILTKGESTGGWLAYAVLAGVSALFMLAVLLTRSLLARWVIPTLARYRSPELVVLSTLVCLGGVTLAAYSVGLPPAVGAFAAGLIFNGNRWSKQIDALVLPFRETFSAIFFVSLGLILDPRILLEHPLTLGVLFLGILVIKTFAATLSLLLTGMKFSHAFGVGIGLAHIGEFAFVLVLQGLDAAVISETEYQSLVCLAVGSLVLTPPLLKAGLRLIQVEEAEALPTAQVSGGPPETVRNAVVIGAGPVGRQMASQLEIVGHDVCLVDLSPINLHPFAQAGFRTVAGDASRTDTLVHAGISDAVLIAVCVPDDHAAVRVVTGIRSLNQDAMLVVRCRYHATQRQLKRIGADLVVSEESEVSVALLKTIESLAPQTKHET